MQEAVEAQCALYSSCYFWNMRSSPPKCYSWCPRPSFQRVSPSLGEACFCDAFEHWTQSLWVFLSCTYYCVSSSLYLSVIFSVALLFFLSAHICVCKRMFHSSPYPLKFKFHKVRPVRERARGSYTHNYQQCCVAYINWTFSSTKKCVCSTWDRVIALIS